MAYTKIIFQNSPSTATPINAQNLNHMDDQIALNDQRLTELEGAHVSSFNGRTGAVAPESGDYNISQIAPLSGAQVGQVPVVVNVGTEEDPELKFAMGAGGGGGHVIQNASGTDMPQESAMQFPDSHVSDDSINGRTVVENVKEVASADYSSETEDGMYLIPDGEGAVIEPASDDKVEVTADGVKTYATLLNELYSKIDSTKLSKESYIYLFDSFYVINAIRNNIYYFCRALNLNTHLYEGTIQVGSSGSRIVEWDITAGGNTQNDVSTTKPTSEEKITLYYGNKKATVDLQTTANRCLLNSGQTVEAKVATIDLGSHANLTSFETAIKNKLSTMKKGDALTGVISTTQKFSPFNISGGQSIIIQARGDNNSTIGMVQVWNQLGYIFYGFLSSDTFTWKTPTLT